MEAVHQYLDRHRERFREELFEFLRFPSVSARGEHREHVRRAARWLTDRLAGMGLEAAVEETAGHPIVLGEWRDADPDAPTILIYGHYDVQPPDPLAMWTTPPFEPDRREGRIYARGAVDDKGQLYLHLAALEAHLRTSGRLPVNVVVLAEGEEEVGSENLLPYVRRNGNRLAADAVIISDTAMIAPDTPTIGASLRGLAYFELHVTGPSQDLHSGSYGGAVVNPATTLARILGSFHDDAGRIAVAGFYDDVDPAEKLRAGFQSLPFDEAAFREETGVPVTGGEEGYTTLERLWIRPTLDVNGLLSGYTGEGPKTVLPAGAMAKMSCRLVPDQDPARIAQLVDAHVRRNAPEGVRVSLRLLQIGEPWRARPGGPLYDAAEAALERAFGRRPVYAGEGGSIPIVPALERVLGAPVLLMGFGLPGQNAHAPDEWISEANFERGAHAAAELLQRLRDAGGSG